MLPDLIIDLGQNDPISIENDGIRVIFDDNSSPIDLILELNSYPVSISTEGFEYTQDTPSTTWVVNHNLQQYPVVEILSPGGQALLAQISHTNINQVICYFSSPLTGKVICA